MSTFSFMLNNQPVKVEAEPDMPLLWVIRDIIGLTGTKFGCGIGQCGACTIHLEAMAIRSCMLPVSAVRGKKVTTIEGICEAGLHPLQQAWIENRVTQCGYCQSGQIMAAVSLLNKNLHPSNSEIDAAMRVNICRCGTYSRIREAIHSASEKMLNKDRHGSK
jgi:aerobic-type carbon monoxide dehydrogenase small subunit (CoxS/CutS family)